MLSVQMEIHLNLIFLCLILVSALELKLVTLSTLQSDRESRDSF